MKYKMIISLKQRLDDKLFFFHFFLIAKNRQNIHKTQQLATHFPFCLLIGSNVSHFLCL